MQSERSFEVRVIEKVIGDVLDAFLHNVKYEYLRWTRIINAVCGLLGNVWSQIATIYRSVV